MDLSALIFVALAVAWAVYLVPKALKHHDDVVRSRSVDRFSQTMRVLARREPVSRRSARLVVTPGRASAPPVVVTKASSASVGSESAPAPASVPAVETSLDASALPPVRTPAQRRAAANRAARRRRRVLVALLGALAAVGVLSIAGLLGPAYLGVPGGLLVAWLVACRLMVRRETGLAGPLARIPAVPLEDDGAETEVPAADEADEADEADMPDATDDAVEGPQTEEVPVVQPEVAAEAPAAGWDPVPVTLPTYVTKPAAERRTVRTIDLDSTGVWTSGRTEVDAALAREGDQAERERRARRDQGDEGRAVGT